MSVMSITSVWILAASLRSVSGGTGNDTLSADWKTLFEPGLYVRFGVLHSPLTIAIGANYQWARRSDEMCGRDRCYDGAFQFGALLSSQPAFSWTLSGVGTLSGSGLYSAPAGSGSATVVASVGGMSSAASVTVTASNTAPVVSTPASASPSPVTGTSTNLSVAATDDAGAFTAGRTTT